MRPSSSTTAFLSLVAASSLGLAVALSGSGCASTSRAPSISDNKPFTSPDDAAASMVEAFRAIDLDSVQAILGPSWRDLGSGDPEQDDADMQRLVADYDRGAQLVEEGDVATLLLGPSDEPWEFPAPLVRTTGGWRFDTATGIDAVRTQRIDTFEGDAIGLMQSFVVAQRQFQAMDPDRDGVLEFAAHLESSPGKRDGLYWPDEEGVPQSPFGPLVAAADESDNIRSDGSHRAYRGYWFKVLNRQGTGAPGGEASFRDASGRMTGGFALIAWPETYGETGIMSFIVGTDGTVFERDLGEDTAALAPAIDSFDPSAGWSVVALQ